MADSQSIVLEDTYDPNYQPTPQEIEEYAKWLGMDPVHDKDLYYIAEEGLKAPLPDHWKPCKTQKGEMYYFNFKTGESIWDHPMDEHYKKRFRDAKQEKAGGKPAEEKAKAEAGRDKGKEREKEREKEKEREREKAKAEKRAKAAKLEKGGGAGKPLTAIDANNTKQQSASAKPARKEVLLAPLDPKARVTSQRVDSDPLKGSPLEGGGGTRLGLRDLRTATRSSSAQLSPASGSLRTPPKAALPAANGPLCLSSIKKESALGESESDDALSHLSARPCRADRLDQRRAHSAPGLRHPAPAPAEGQQAGEAAAEQQRKSAEELAALRKRHTQELERAQQGHREQMDKEKARCAELLRREQQKAEERLHKACAEGARRLERARQQHEQEAQRWEQRAAQVGEAKADELRKTEEEWQEKISQAAVGGVQRLREVNEEWDGKIAQARKRKQGELGEIERQELTLAEASTRAVDELRVQCAELRDCCSALADRAVRAEGVALERLESARRAELTASALAARERLLAARAAAAEAATRRPPTPAPAPAPAPAPSGADMFALPPSRATAPCLPVQPARDGAREERAAPAEAAAAQELARTERQAQLDLAAVAAQTQAALQEAERARARLLDELQERSRAAVAAEEARLAALQRQRVADAQQRLAEEADRRERQLLREAEEHLAERERALRDDLDSRQARLADELAAQHSQWLREREEEYAERRARELRRLEMREQEAVRRAEGASLTREAAERERAASEARAQSRCNELCEYLQQQAQQLSEEAALAAEKLADGRRLHAARLAAGATVQSEELARQRVELDEVRVRGRLATESAAAAAAAAVAERRGRAHDVSMQQQERLSALEQSAQGELERRRGELERRARQELAAAEEALQAELAARRQRQQQELAELAESSSAAAARCESLQVEARQDEQRAREARAELQELRARAEQARAALQQPAARPQHSDPAPRCTGQQHGQCCACQQGAPQSCCCSTASGTTSSSTRSETAAPLPGGGGISNADAIMGLARPDPPPSPAKAPAPVGWGEPCKARGWLAGEWKQLNESREALARQRKELKRRKKELKAARSRWRDDMASCTFAPGGGQQLVLQTVHNVLEQRRKGLEYDEQMLTLSEQWLHAKAAKLQHLEVRLPLAEQAHPGGLDETATPRTAEAGMGPCGFAGPRPHPAPPAAQQPRQPRGRRGRPSPLDVTCIAAPQPPQHPAAITQLSEQLHRIESQLSQIGGSILAEGHCRPSPRQPCIDDGMQQGCTGHCPSAQSPSAGERGEHGLLTRTQSAPAGAMHRSRTQAPWDPNEDGPATMPAPAQQVLRRSATCTETDFAARWASFLSVGAP